MPKKGGKISWMRPRFHAGSAGPHPSVSRPITGPSEDVKGKTQKKLTGWRLGPAGDCIVDQAGRAARPKCQTIERE